MRTVQRVFQVQWRCNYVGIILHSGLLKRQWLLTAHAGDPRCVPLAASAAADGRRVPLDEAWFAVVAEQGVDLVARLHGAKHAGILDHWGLSAWNWQGNKEKTTIYFSVHGWILLFYINKTAVSWRPTGSLFASECQVVVAGHVVPLAILVPYHHHAVLPRLEEAIRLVWPPVVILLCLCSFKKQKRNVLSVNCEVMCCDSVHSDWEYMEFIMSA